MPGYTDRAIMVVGVAIIMVMKPQQQDGKRKHDQQ
jgi:hypothetical protein